MKDELTLLHVSDTHSYHDLLKIPDNIDLVIHSGDESNYRDKIKNSVEFNLFIDWFKELPIKHKIFVPGNHSAHCYFNSGEVKLLCRQNNIIYLENDYCEIEGIKIFGTPTTPTFNDWYFMKNRSKLDAFWSNITEDIDIFVSHGPCKGILDLSEDVNGNLEYCGDKALHRHITQRIKPKLFLSGHIHSNNKIENTGVYYRDGIHFSNAAAMKDGKFGIIHCNGNLFSISLLDKKVSII